MKPYSIAVVFLYFTLLAMGFSSVAAANNSDKDQEKKTMDALFLPVGTMTLYTPPHIKKKRSPVIFPHSDHFIYTCNTCHHEWDMMSPMKSCSTSGCHDQKRPNSKTTSAESTEPQPPGKPYFQNAFHETCIGCHRAMIAEKKAYEKKWFSFKKIPAPGPTGPDRCIQCHPKKLK